MSEDRVHCRTSNLPLLDFDDTGKIINLKGLLKQSIKAESAVQLNKLFGEAFTDEYICRAFKNLDLYFSHWRGYIRFLHVYSNKWVVIKKYNDKRFSKESIEVISGEMLLWLNAYPSDGEITVSFCKLPASKVIPIACSNRRAQKIRS